MTAIRVLIADDHPLFLSGLRALLNAEDDTELVGEAGSGEEAVELTAASQPDVVLMDLSMPGIGGVEAMRQVTDRFPDIAILALTMSVEDSVVIAAIEAGARGFLVKGSSGAETMDGIRAAARGEAVFSPQVAGYVLGRLSGRTSVAFPELTERERDVLRLMARGLTNTAIAGQLFLGQKTVRNYVSRIFWKLGADNRIEAILRAREAGLS